MRIPEHIIDQVRDSNEIVNLVGSYLKLKRKGVNYFAVCPFHHEKTPSFSVNASKQIWHCFGCNRGGNVFSFVMEYEKVNFIDAVKMLAENAGIELPESGVREEGESKSAVLYKANRTAASEYHKQLMSDDGKSARDYLSDRGIAGEMLKIYGIGLAPGDWEWLKPKLTAKGFDEKSLMEVGLIGKNEQGKIWERFKGRIIFPVLNEAGKVVAFGGRIWADNDTEAAKYVNSSDSPIYSKGRVLYGLFQTKEDVRKSNQIVLVEGYTDLLSVVASGVTNAVATSGTALTTGQARLAKRYADSAVLLYDGDDAGRKAAARAAIALMESGFDVRIAKLPDGSDPDSFVREEGSEKLQTLIADAVGYVDFRVGLLSEEELSESTLKVRAIRGIVEELFELRDELVKAVLLKDFASALGVDAELLKQESKKFKPYDNREENEREKVTVKLKSLIQKIEYQLVMLLLSSNQEIISSAKEFLHNYDVSHEALAQIAGVLMKDENRGNDSKLFDEIDDPVERALLMKLMEEISSVNDESKTLSESKSRLIMLKLEGEIKTVREKLRIAESKGEDISTLLREQKELTDKLKSNGEEEKKEPDLFN